VTVKWDQTNRLMPLCCVILDLFPSFSQREDGPATLIRSSVDVERTCRVVGADVESSLSDSRPQKIEKKTGGTGEKILFLFFVSRGELRLHRTKKTGGGKRI
jgi:hypothetical protein